MPGFLPADRIIFPAARVIAGIVAGTIIITKSAVLSCALINIVARYIAGPSPIGAVINQFDCDLVYPAITIFDLSQIKEIVIGIPLTGVAGGLIAVAMTIVALRTTFVAYALITATPSAVTLTGVLTVLRVVVITGVAGGILIAVAMTIIALRTMVIIVAIGIIVII